MSSKVNTLMGGDEDFSSARFLRDVEEISKALYLRPNPLKAFNLPSDHRSNVAARTTISGSDSKFLNEDSRRKDKKSSIWNWKLLRALAHIRNQRFNCFFFLHVHAVEGLPSNFNNLNLCLTWKRKGVMIRTRPAPICAGMSEFEETLMHRCTVYASRTGRRSSVKYESKLFLLQTSVIEAPELEIGKHWIDLTRLLPLTLDELERENRSSQKWTTSFKLAGFAKGAMLHVSFTFSISDSNSFEPGYFVKVPDVVRVNGPFKETRFDDLGRISRTSHNRRNLDTVATNLAQESHQSQSVDISSLDETFTTQEPELSQSLTLLSRNEEKTSSDIESDFFHDPLNSMRLKCDLSPDYAGNLGLNVGEQGVQLSMKESFRRGKHGSQRFDSSLIQTIDAEDIFKEEESAFDAGAESNIELHKSVHEKNECATEDTKFKHDSNSVKEPTFQEPDSVSYVMLTSGSVELDSLQDRSKYHKQENCPATKSSFYESESEKSLSLDDVAESVENDFLKMLSIEQTPASKISEIGTDSPGDTLLRLFEEDIAWKNDILDTDDSEVSLGIQAVETDHGSLTRSVRSKRNTKVHEWGLEENTFQTSACDNSGGFGSPVYFPEEEPLKLPNLGEGLGPIIQTKDGGFLRSMNPLLFVKANNGARLIAQISAPVVLPQEMGFRAMDILQHWAAAGVDKLSTQAMKLMPLEDITRKTLKQVLSEAESRSKRCKLQHECKVGFGAFAEKETADMESEYASYENLVHTAMTNIEGLLIEGLKIQTGMADQEAPSHIRIPIPANSASVVKTTDSSENFGVDRTGKLVQDVDELVKYFMSLEEWLRLDSGDFVGEDKNDKKFLNVFAAHCAKNIDLSSGQLINENQAAHVFSNNFTMAMHVQLGNPLRDYETVGSSMLALIQVKKVCNVETDNLDDQKDTGFVQNQNMLGNSTFHQFKISEVHLAGFLGNQQLWGTSRQHQSGLRWLLSSGMVSTEKHTISNSNAIAKSSPGIRKAWHGDVLWSISSPTQCEATAWDESVGLNVHVRNPDIIFPNESSG